MGWFRRKPDRSIKEIHLEHIGRATDHLSDISDVVDRVSIVVGLSLGESNAFSIKQQLVLKEAITHAVYETLISVELREK